MKASDESNQDWISFSANKTQIEKAKELVKKLQFAFTSESFENPQLQQHYAAVEALALERDAPEEVADFTRETISFVTPAFDFADIHICSYRSRCFCPQSPTKGRLKKEQES